jgi:hypothetical protein
MRLNFAEAGISSKVNYCHDGQETIDAAVRISKEALSNGNPLPVRPISLMFLDF